MTTQDMMDWAFAQNGGLTVELKLTLLALSFSAGPGGGSALELGFIARRTSSGVRRTLVAIQALARRGLITVDYRGGFCSAGRKI